MSAPEGWRELSPHEIAGDDKSALVIGPFGSSLKTSDYRTEGAPLVFVRDVRSGEFTQPRHFVDPQKAAELLSHQVLPGDVLITKMGDPPGDSCIYTGTGPGVITADCIRLRPASEFDPRYVSLVLGSPQVRRQMEAITSGVAQRKVSLARFRSGLRIPIPDLDEQRRIVDLLEDHLSRLDAAERLLVHNASKLAALRERTVIGALTGSDVPNRHDVAPEPVGTADGTLPSLPCGWLWSRLGDVADVVGGITKDTKKQADPTYVEVPYLRVANVQRGRLQLDDVATIRVAPAKAEALKLLPGDVLLNEGGDRDKLARGWVWEGQVGDCIHQNHVFRARLRDPRLDPYFLSLTANTFGGKWAERNGKQSVNLASISLSVIRKMPVIIPAAGEAVRIVAAIRERQAEYDRLDDAIAQSRRRIVALRKSLLAAAFAGRLTATTPAPESVSP